MATVTARTLPWYSPPRVKQAMRQARRLPVVPLALLTFLLVIPAALAPQVARAQRPRRALQTQLEPPAARHRAARSAPSAACALVSTT